MPKTNPVPIPSPQELAAEAAAYRCLMELGADHWEAEYGASLAVLMRDTGYRPQTRYERNLKRKIGQLLKQHKAASAEAQTA